MPNISLEATLDSAPQASGIEKEGSVRLSESCRSFVGHDRQFMADNTHQMAGSEWPLMLRSFPSENGSISVRTILEAVIQRPLAIGGHDPFRPFDFGYSSFRYPIG